MPHSQFGAVSGGGTDLAHHFLLVCIEFAQKKSLSIFILFLDLVKAFGKALRELVFGFPQDVAEDDQVAYLMSIGVPAHDAQWLVDFIRSHGTVFYQMEC